MGITHCTAEYSASSVASYWKKQPYHLSLKYASPLVQAPFTVHFSKHPIYYVSQLRVVLVVPCSCSSASHRGGAAELSSETPHQAVQGYFSFKPLSVKPEWLPACLFIIFKVWVDVLHFLLSHFLWVGMSECLLSWKCFTHHCIVLSLTPVIFDISMSGCPPWNNDTTADIVPLVMGGLQAILGGDTISSDLEYHRFYHSDK